MKALGQTHCLPSKPLSLANTQMGVVTLGKSMAGGPQLLCSVLSRLGAGLPNWGPPHQLCTQCRDGASEGSSPGRGLLWTTWKRAAQGVVAVTGNLGGGSLTSPLPPVPLPDHVLGGYPTSLGTGVLSYAESTHSLNHSASLAGLW